MMRTLLITTLLTAYLVAGAAQAQSTSLPSDKRIKLLSYDESDIYTIQTRYGYQTSVVFGAQEDIQTISVGDRSTWQIIPSGNRLFIRPLIENVTTNMTIITSKHSYQFDLKSASSAKDAKGGRPEDVVYVAKFVYPDKTAPEPSAPSYQSTSTSEPAADPTPAQTTASRDITYIAMPLTTPDKTLRAPKSTGFKGPATPQNPNYNYTYSGPDDLAPLEVYDDGMSTFIKYSNMNQPVPNVFIRSNGRETPVSNRIVDGRMIIDVVTGELVLKNSNGTIHVYNEIINPGR